MEHEQAVRNLAVECYLLGEMSPAERAAFEEHYFECAICGEDVRAASQFLSDMKEIFASGRQPATMPARNDRSHKDPSGRTRWGWPAWMRPQFAAAAIAIVAAVAGIEALSTISRLRNQVQEAAAPRVARYQVLRPQTRGDATVVNVPAGEPAVLLFDLPEFPPALAAKGLQFVVKSADGRGVFEVNAGSLGPGDPVTLSIPKLDLPAGNYTLIVETPAEPGKDAQELGQYPFELKHQ